MQTWSEMFQKPFVAMHSRHCSWVKPDGSATSFQGCEAQFKAYLVCIASAPATCSNGSLDFSGCEGALAALNNCAGTVTGTSGGSGGSAGASGISPFR